MSVNFALPGQVQLEDTPRGEQGGQNPEVDERMAAQEIIDTSEKPRYAELLKLRSSKRNLEAGERHRIDDHDFDFAIVWRNAVKPPDAEEEEEEEAHKITKASCFDKCNPNRDLEREVDSKEAWMACTPKEYRHRVISRLKHAGLTVVSFKNQIDKYLLITASEKRLELQAELRELNMQLKPEHGSGVQHFKRANADKFVPMSEHGTSHFSSLQRQFLVNAIIFADEEEGGAGIDLEKEVKNSRMSKAFPLHHQGAKNGSPEYGKGLMESWATKGIIQAFRPQPLERIRHYMGEHLALYFAFIQFYTIWLAIASILGFVTFIFIFIDKTGIAQSSYMLFLCFWATFFLNFWKRRQATLLFKWNMTGYQQADEVRLQFRGQIQEGVYHENLWLPGESLRELEMVGLESEGQKMPMNRYSKPRTKFMKYVAGAVPMFTLLAMVIIVTVSILTFRLFLQTSSVALFGGIIGGVLNAISIQVLNLLYKKIAQVLVDWENHRTETDYDNALIIRTFLFQFVNSYTSLFYVAFFKNGAKLPFVEDADACKFDYSKSAQNPAAFGCLDELTVQLAALLGTNIIWGQTQELLLPWAKKKYHHYKHKSEETTFMQPWETEAAYTDYPGTRDEYLEMVIQYGYVVMFAAAFPLAPLMAFINNIVEIRTDAWKFMTQFNRPLYRGTSGIGVWYMVLEVIGFIAIVTNCLILAFTSGVLANWFNGDILLTFAMAVIFEHILLILKLAVAYTIPDYPKNIRISLAVQAYIQELVLRRVLYKQLAGEMDWGSDDDDCSSSSDDEKDTGRKGR